MGWSFLLDKAGTLQDSVQQCQDSSLRSGLFPFLHRKGRPPSSDLLLHRGHHCWPGSPRVGSGGCGDRSCYLEEEALR